MRFTILKINEFPLYIPLDNVGVVSVCNNKNGTEFHCFVKDSIDQKRKLHLGNRLDIDLVSLDSSNSPTQFRLPDDFIKSINYSSKEEGISDGIEVKIGDSMISTPFIEGEVQSVLITVNKGECSLKVGGMTSDNELLDYYYSMLSVGDNISISLKSLTQISKPICRRPFKGCDYRN
jgi:hypothetical protein